MDMVRILDLSRRFLQRALTADFQREHASDEERTTLAAQPKPITDPLAQDYVAWRRAALWLAGVVLSVGLLLTIIDHQPIAEAMAEGIGPQATVEQVVKAVGEANVALLDDLQYFDLLLKACIAGLVFYAAHSWQLVNRSRSVARWAWLVALLIPLAVSAWPWATSLDFSHLDQVDQFGRRIGDSSLVKRSFATIFASATLVTLGPKLLALFPGIMRSSLTLKTLLPEATAPGWLTVVFAPFMAGFLLLLLCLLSQTEGSLVAIGAILLLAIGPCVYVRRARDLVRPHTAAEVSTVVRGVRKQALMFSGAGLVLLLVYLFSLESLSKLTIAHVLIEAVGSILLTMVAISDITLALLAFSQRQGATFQSSELRVAYEQRLQALGAAGLTDVESALGVHDLANLRK